MNWGEILRFFIKVWNYQIVSIDSNSITIGTLVIGGLFLLIGFVISKKISKKVVSRLLKKTNLEKGSLHTFETLSFYGLLIIFSLFSLKMANIPITVFTLLGGAFAIGIGFGTQNILNNFISGLIIMIERPIEVGDFIEVDGSFGLIEDIGTRSTTIASPGGKDIIVPNSFFLDKKVQNWTHLNDIVRANILVGVAYGSDSQQVERILLESLKEEKAILTDRKNFVWFKDFGDNALVFDLNFWIRLRGITDLEDVQSRLRHVIYRKCNEEQIVIAFPQRDVHLFPQGNFKVEVQERSSQ